MISFKKISYYLLIVLSIFIGIKVKAKSIYDYEYLTNYDYVIEKYNIDIVVNENNTFNITEDITALFREEKHGIIRSIPLQNEISRLDGTVSKNRASVKKLKVDNKYKKTKSDGYLKLQIGDARNTIIGKQDYKISYIYNIGKDPLEDKDEFYFNIIGNEWDTIIGDITFKITMPKDFDASKLGFSAGPKGATNSNNIKYHVNGRVIEGSYEEILRANEALTIRLELEDGYFVNAFNSTDVLNCLLFLIPLGSLIIAIILWYKYGKDEKIIETVEFYPPEGLNSLEVSYLYNGKAKREDVISLLIYLANKGYFKITKTNEKSLFFKFNGFKLTKLKDYDGDNINERIFMEGLFKYNSEVTDTMLSDFYITASEILNNINSKENKKALFGNLSSNCFKLVILAVITYLTFMVIPTFIYGENMMFMTIVISLFYLPFYLVGFLSSMPFIIRVFWLGFTIFHSSIFFLTLPIAKAMISEKIYLLGFIFGIMCLIGIGICYKYMPKRTKYGAEMYGKIKGFKNFLETCEKERLEALVEQNPTYFYDILPYTYVLGVSDKWIKDFENITLVPPTWYDCPDGYDFMVFGTFMNSTMEQAKKTIAPVSSSGGGFSSSGGSSSGSGGGSSGSGSGGGGGSSW